MSNEDELRRAVTSADLRAAADYHDSGSSQEQVAADWILMAARHIELLQEMLAEVDCRRWLHDELEHIVALKDPAEQAAACAMSFGKSFGLMAQLTCITGAPPYDAYWSARLMKTVFDAERAAGMNAARGQG